MNRLNKKFRRKKQNSIYKNNKNNKIIVDCFKVFRFKS
jgi:hypothetical protein